MSDFLHCKGHTREDDAHLQIVSQILPSLNTVHKRILVYVLAKSCKIHLGNLFLNIFSVKIKIRICLLLNFVLE